MTRSPEEGPACLEILNPRAPRDGFTDVVFDFDGTISVIRRGWQNVMGPLMVEMISGKTEPTPEIEKEVADYIDRSTGIMTIFQMKWLEEAVERYGLAGKPLTAPQYKEIYKERLLRYIADRLQAVADGNVRPDDMMTAGSVRFLEALGARGLTLHLASGTDQEDVRREAGILGLRRFFGDNVYGAVGYSEECSKEAVLKSLIEDERLCNRKAAVFGDGPVEIRVAKEHGVLAVGVASDEYNLSGLDPRKRERLIGAGADVIIPDFSRPEEIIGFMFPD